MGQVETVALWAGLISSVVSIVLSIVAIVVSVLVEKQSSQVAAQTIQSLQKIESAVERLSSDTRELVKAGWDKMLGNVAGPGALPASMSDSSAKSIASGIAAEVRAELVPAKGDTAEQSAVPSGERIERLLKNLEASVEAQLRATRASRPSEALDRAFAAIADLQPRSRALLRALSRRHLTMEQYRRLSQSELGSALDELRQNGLIVPVTHRSDDGVEVPGYYMPPGLAGMVRAALPLFPQRDERAMALVRSVLAQLGYPPTDHKTEEPGSVGGERRPTKA